MHTKAFNRIQFVAFRSRRLSTLLESWQYSRHIILSIYISSMIKKKLTLRIRITLIWLIVSHELFYSYALPLCILGLLKY